MAETTLATFQLSVKKAFNTDQLTAMTRCSTMGMEWSEAAVEKALTLRFFRWNNWLPGAGQLWEPSPVCQHAPLSPGILESVFLYMQPKVGAHSVIDSFIKKNIPTTRQKLLYITPTESFPISFFEG